MDPSRLQGVTLLYDILSSLTWFMAYFDIMFETQSRNIAQISRYSSPLLLYWSLMFFKNNLVLLSWNNDDWWFQRHDTVDLTQFILFWIRYSLSGFLFLLGMKAPGLYHKPPHLVPADDDILRGTPTVRPILSVF